MAKALIFPRTITIFILIILAFLINLSQIESLRFALQSGHSKCIGEEIKINSMSVGKYHVVNFNEGDPMPDSHKITVRVSSSHGSYYHHADNVVSGQFAFTAPVEGDYMTCFWTPEHEPPRSVTIDFDWKTGVSAKNWGQVAKKGTVDAMRFELKKLTETVNSIHEEMFYLRDREDEMQELNRTTNSQMFWLGFLSVFVCLSVAGVQVRHLKTFFERKKLL